MHFEYLNILLQILNWLSSHKLIHHYTITRKTPKVNEQAFKIELPEQVKQTCASKVAVKEAQLAAASMTIPKVGVLSECNEHEIAMLNY